MSKKPAKHHRPGDFLAAKENLPETKKQQALKLTLKQ